MIPRFGIVIGAPKCGTTSLFQYLAQHPQVVPSRVKEPNFFGDTENWGRGLAWYENLWEWDPSRHGIALEASTDYTIAVDRNPVPERMVSTGREFRLIYLVRDPVRRVESHIAHAASSGVSIQAPAGDWMVRFRFLAASLYARQLDAFAKAFPRDAILVLRLEDLQADPRTVMARVSRHLEIDATFAYDLDAAHNVGEDRRVFRSGLRPIVRKLPMRALMRVVPGRLQRMLKSTPAFRDQGARVKLNDAERALLREFFAADAARLRDEWRIDIRSWGYE